MADIYTCIGPDGTTASQDRPCAGAQQQTRHQVTAAEAKQPAEAMVSFGWSKDDLRAEVVRGNLPTFAAD